MASAGVLVLTISFVLYALRLSQGDTNSLTSYKASFISANGLAAGAKVTLGGVVIGRVNSITLNPVLGKVLVAFGVDSQFHLPADTAVTIGSSTLTGENALKLLIGKSHESLAAGSTINDARPLLSLEQQISNYIFNVGGL
ncbi:MCE family protein [Aristophania vespae]|uniref:MCE family protein n=1 Tax=Aristophania vespae TaxID=2697033 RepID=A0A6P1NIM9_9PROT|nr:MCE family protein [Aristophania vespae]